MHELWATAFPFWHFILRGGLIYVFILLLLKLGGKREVGHLGTGEFVAVLLISNAVQNAMNGGDNSITGGMILASVIVALSVGVSYLTYKSKRWESFIQGEPALLIHQGEILKRNLEKELLNVRELKTILRRQGIQSLNDVHQAVLESDGSISVIKKSEFEGKNGESKGENSGTTTPTTKQS